MHRAAALAEGKIMQRVVLSVIRSLSRICFARSWIGLLMKNLYYSALRLYLYGWGGQLTVGSSIPHSRSPILPSWIVR